MWMVVVCAVVLTGRSATNTPSSVLRAQDTIISVQGANAVQGRKSREKRGSGPTACRSKDPQNLMLYQARNSAAAHEPSASTMAAKPFVFDAAICSDRRGQGSNGRIDRPNRHLW